jgi:N-acyl-D-amino-acid deacylase
MFAPLLLAALTATADPPKTTLVRGATILDGTGSPGYVGDVLLTGDKIAAVGNLGGAKADRTIDAAGMIVCPGFIDLHTHCDSIATAADKANGNYVRQGCTTVATGNCGSGPVDAAKYFAEIEKNGAGTNVVHWVPHNAVRNQVTGNVARVPTADEQAKMEALTDKAMADGAWGLSTGLIYNPGTYAKTEEIVGLAKVAARHGGLYVSHIRNEGEGLLDAIEEALRIGREAGLPVHVSHIKASGKAAWGKSAEAVALIEAARKKGQPVTADQYPYVASSTSLRATVVPTKYREGGQKEFVARLDDPATGPKLKADVARAVGDGSRLQIARYARDKTYQGKTVAAIAAAQKKAPIDIVLDIERNGGASVVNFGMTEEDVRIYMTRPWVATASDGGVQSGGGDTVPHPRSYGTFPRKVGRYAIADGVVTVEQAVRSSSGLPADILKLADRGYLKPGQFADVVVFDPKAYRDTATFDKPHQYPTGVAWVFVNGAAVVADGTYDPAVLAGRPLRHPGPGR